MRKFTLTFMLLLDVLTTFAQSPAGFNYQAVLRDASGNIRANANVAIRIDIIKTSATGTSVYAETFAATTNTFGLINLQVGKGTVVSGTFNTIDWSTGSYFIKITIDGTEMSTSQMMSVPYALYASKAGNGFSGAYNDLTGKPNLFSGNYNDLSAKPILATVATSGSYSDLLNKPSLTETDPVYGVSVAKSIKASDTTRWSAKSNFSGEYKDVFNTPTRFDLTKYNISTGNFSDTWPSQGQKNTAMGTYALLVNTGTENTAIGSMALRSNTTGKYNTSIGSVSMWYNLGGDGNVAVGGASLYGNKSGNNNIAIGLWALGNETSGNGNVALGYRSLYNNLTADYNVAVGFQSLYSNQTGFANTAIGTHALKSNIIGRWNTAVGDSALLNSNTDKNTGVGYKSLNVATGWDNTAVGYASLLKNTDGFDNVAIGVDALNSNTSGDGNTAVGKNTLTGCATGNNNTAIGSRADVTGNYSNATAIGYFAIADANNKVVIGNSDVTSIGGKVSWSLTSDARLKENIVYNNKLGLNFISSLKTATYHYKNDKSQIQYNGLVAQDVQKLLNDLGLQFSGLVVEDNPEKYLRLSYAEFVIPLINSVQELNKQNQQLQQKNETLEATINSMKADLELLKNSIQK